MKCCLLIGAWLLYAGLGYTQLPPASFYHLRRDERLLSHGYHCLAEDQYGFIWFGSWYGGGLYRYDGYDLRSFVVDPDKPQSTIPSNQINTITRLGDHQLCIGTHEGLAVMDIVTGEVKNYQEDNSNAPDFYSFYAEPIVPDSMHHCTWIGSGFGLHKLNWDLDSVEYVIHTKQDISEPNLEGVIDLLIDNQDPEILWMGTRNGLFSHRIDRNEIKHFTPTVPLDVILDLYQDLTGDLWMCVPASNAKNTGAVIRFSPSDNSWTRFDLNGSADYATEKHSTAFYILASAQQGKLWVSTYGKVGLFDTDNGTFEAWQYHPSQPDGLLENGFYRNMLSDRNGRLWITAWEGIQYAKTSFVVPGKHVSGPRVWITDVQISNATPDSTKPLLFTGPLTLNDDQHDITFRYVLPNPLNPATVTYQYMLKGRDKEWTTTDQRTAQYMGLKGGEYSFLIKAREGSKEWTAIAELPVTIKKRLLEYAWFWIVTCILLTGIIIGVSFFFIHRTRKEEKMKAEFDRKISEIEMKALRAQMNPHFLFNSLNAIKYYTISKDKDETAEYLSKFALLVRAILNNSKSRTISLKDELTALSLYIEIEHLRLEGKFKFEIDIDKSLRVERAQIPPMVLQPYVENAIWHGLMHRNGGGVLKVQVKDFGGQVQCIIEDNGIGREKANAIRDSHQSHKTSMGMKITADRISLINKIYGIDTQVHIVDLYDENRHPSGTRIIINIPIIEDPDSLLTAS